MVNVEDMAEKLGEEGGPIWRSRGWLAGSCRRKSESVLRIGRLESDYSGGV